MTDVHTLLARNLKKYREILGFSQAKLAEKINCSTTFIGNIEIKKRFPSPKNLDNIAKALGVKVQDLFSETEPESMKVMTAKKDMKSKLKKLVDKAVDEVFK